MGLNAKREKGRHTTSHANFMSGPSWDISDPLTKLRIAATSSFFGEPAYYVDGDSKPKTIKSIFGRSSGGCSTHLRSMLGGIDVLSSEKTTGEAMEEAIDAALALNIEATLKFAVELRNEWNIRTTPQVIMVRAAMHPSIANTGLLAKYASKIMVRLDEVMNQMAYFETLNGSLRHIPSRLKRAWAKRLQSADEYQLAKYRLEGRKVNLFDAVNITHPKRTPGLNKLMTDGLTLGGDNQTWESIISGGGSWKRAVDVMGHMALLRNLRNLEKAGEISPDLMVRLKEGVPQGRQLPFRYFSAYKVMEKESAGSLVLDTLEECMEIALENCPSFAGRTMSLVDNSGSAQNATTSSMGIMRIADIGNLMGVITGKRSEDGYVGVFGNNLETFSIRKKASIFDQAKHAGDLGYHIGKATENGIWLFWANAIKLREHWDNVFIYSDMQAGHGGLYGVDPNGYRDYTWSDGCHIDVPKLINHYRRDVNPNVNVFLVQIAGYQDVIVPEFYDRTYILGGWSEKILTFANQLIRMRQ